MSKIAIECPRCSQETYVAMTQSLSSQRCDKCRMFLYGSNTTASVVAIENNKSGKGKKQWRSLTSTASSEAKSLSVDQTDAFRKGWQSWYLPTFSLTLAVVIIGIVLLVRNAHRRPSTPSPASDLVIQSSLTKAEQEQEKRRMAASIGKNMTEQAPDDQWAIDAPKISDQFLRAVSSQQIMAVIRDAPKHEASVNAFAAKLENLPISKRGSLGILYAPEPEEKDTHRLAMMFYFGSDDQIRGLIIAQTPDGLKVDWESFTGEGDMSIAELLSKKPATVVQLRVNVREDDYFSHRFSKSDEFVCLRMTDIHNTVTLFGYIPKGTPLATRVAGIPVQNHEAPEIMQARALPLTIKVKFTNNTASNQVEIVDIVGTGWFVP